jgi:hypothetical protein
MRTHFEFRHILHLVLMAALDFTELRIKLTLFYSLKSCGRFETFSSGLCMQPLFIAVRIYLCARVRIWF